jgi:hypothetical protein
MTMRVQAIGRGRCRLRFRFGHAGLSLSHGALDGAKRGGQEWRDAALDVKVKVKARSEWSVVCGSWRG